MRIANSITERDALLPRPLVCQAVGDGTWRCYDEGDQLPTPTAIAPADIISASDFRDRFTQDEILSIVTKAYAGDAQLQYLLLKLQTNTSGVNLLDAETIAGVNYIASVGSITQARVAEVLA